MTDARYLPATRTKVRSLRLGRLSVRSADDRELGKLLGFMIDSRDGHLCSLVVEVSQPTKQQVELPMVPLCLDSNAHALRLISRDLPLMQTFQPETVSEIDEDDLWVPLFDHAA